jgi:hypothetical protein
VAYSALLAADSLAERASRLLQPTADWLRRDEQSLLRERARATAARRARPSAPSAGGASDTPAAALWELPAQPSAAEAASEAWRSGEKERSAASLEARQAVLGVELRAAVDAWRAEAAAAHAEAERELEAAAGRLERALAQSNARLAMALAEQRTDEAAA